MATHHGTFRLTDDGAERIGDSLQDTMGFTVVGPGHFLGSGHPDVAGLQAGQPGRLGPIESTDGGHTWRTRSLSGEADFRALASADGQVYGWDSTSGRFMASTDRESFDVRSTLDLYGFAVDPADPDQVVAATPAGPQASIDGGRSWHALAGPPLVAVSWDVDSGLWGADANGQVAVSTDAGQSWQSRGTLAGTPQAFLADGSTLYAAVAEGAAGDSTGIYGSNDGGETWALCHRDDG